MRRDEKDSKSDSDSLRHRRGGLGEEKLVVPALPYLLSFAAGVMIYVVVEELIPEMSEGKHSNIGTVLFVAGFTLMMALG